MKYVNPARSRHHPPASLLVMCISTQRHPPLQKEKDQAAVDWLWGNVCSCNSGTPKPPIEGEAGCQVVCHPRGPPLAISAYPPVRSSISFSLPPKVRHSSVYPSTYTLSFCTHFREHTYHSSTCRPPTLTNLPRDHSLNNVHHVRHRTSPFRAADTDFNSTRQPPQVSAV